MNELDTRRYQMLLRVLDFGRNRPAIFPAATLGGRVFADLAAAIEQLRAHVSGQLSGRSAVRASVKSQAVARQTLRSEIDAVIRTARAMSLDRPGVRNKFRPIRGSGERRLLNAARAFARDAAGLRKQFLAYGMPNDFLDALHAAIRRLENARRDRVAGVSTHVAARTDITTTMKAALAAVCRLDAVVANHLKDDSAALAMWTRVRRLPVLDRKSQRPARRTALTIGA